MSYTPLTAWQRRWWLPSVEVLIFLLVFLQSLMFMPQMMNGDGDLGRHITIGRTILAQGSIPTADPYSHTMSGQYVVPHEWISQTIFALAHRAAGLNGVAWLTALILAASYALLTAGLRWSGVRSLVALGGGFLAALAGTLHALTRPHIYTLLFFTLFVLIVEHYRRTGRWRMLLPLPLLMVLWANTHGAFISAFVVTGMYAIGSLFDREWHRAGVMGLLLMALMGASWLNPMGPSLVSHSFAYLQERFLVDQTVEYRSPDFHVVSTWPFAGILLGTLALGWRSNKQLNWTSLLLLGGWSAMALYSARNIPLYTQMAIILLAQEADEWLTELWPPLGRFLDRTENAGKLAWGWMWAALFVVVLVGLEGAGFTLDVWGKGNRFDGDKFPVAAIDALQGDLPEGPVFNEFTWGGYLLYRLFPEKQVFIDGQTDFYGEALTREYLQVRDAQPGWQEVLERYGVRWIILPPDRPVAPWLDLAPEWERIYEDRTAVVWLRR